MASVLQPVGSDLITQCEEPFVGSEMILCWPWVPPHDNTSQQAHQTKRQPCTDYFLEVLEQMASSGILYLENNA